MKRMKKLFEISEQILKLEKMKSKKFDPVYDELIEELSEKEKQIVKNLESNYYEFIEFMMNVGNYFEYDFESFFGINYLKANCDSPELLHVLGLIQNVYEFFKYQDFSALNQEEVMSLNNNEYFNKYIEMMHCYDDWKYMVYEEFLKLTGKNNPAQLHAVSYLNDYGKKEVIGGFINSSAYADAIGIEINSIKELFLRIILVGSNASKYEEEKLLFEACLKFIPEKYLVKLRNSLLKSLGDLDSFILENANLDAANKILKKYNIKPIKLNEIVDIDDNNLTILELLKMYYDRKFSLEEIKMYDNILKKLIDIDINIWNLYQKLLIIFFNFKKGKEAKKIISLLEDLILKEKKLFNEIDIFDFKEYVSKMFSIEIDICPFNFLHFANLEDENHFKEFVLERILNYSFENNNSDKKVWYERNNLYGINLDMLFRDQCIDVEKFLFWQDMYNLGKIDKKQLLEEQKRLGFNFEKVMKEEKEEYLDNIFINIERKFWDNLMQSKYSYLLCQFLFTRNQKMNELIFNNFWWKFSENIGSDLPFYDDIRKAIFEDFKLVLENYKNETSDFSNEILKIYLDSCCSFLKEEDQDTLKRMFIKCEKEVKLRRKKD